MSQTDHTDAPSARQGTIGQSENGGYGMVYRWVIDQCRQEPWALMLYASLAEHADQRKDNGWTLGRETLAEELGASVSTVDRAVRHLVAIGALEVVHNRKGREWSWSRFIVKQNRPVGSSPVTNQQPHGSSPVTACVITGDDIPETPTPRPPTTRSSAKPMSQKRQKAEEIVREWWDSLETKPAQSFIGIVKLIESLGGKGWTVSEIKQALRDVPTVTGPALDFWRGNRSKPASTVQALADVDARTADEVERAIVAGDPDLAWRLIRAKAKARGERWFDQLAQQLAIGREFDVASRLGIRRDGRKVTVEDWQQVIAARDEVIRRAWPDVAAVQPGLTP